jgi:thiol-disulfide isomerase/thioredoxin
VDLRVPFAPGADVVDGSAGVAYHVGDNGKVSAKPLADVATGKARTAEAGELAEVLEINPVLDDVTEKGIERRKERVAAWAARNEARKHAGDPVWGKAAPAFDKGATWKNSEPLDWEKLRGKVVILHFFAEWCGPCKNDYPMLRNLHGREGNADRKLVIIGIHTAGSAPAKVDSLLEEFKIGYPVCVDAPMDRAEGRDKGWGKTFVVYGAEMAPHAILVNWEGKVVERGMLMDVYDAAIELLAKK